MVIAISTLIKYQIIYVNNSNNVSKTLRDTKGIIWIRKSKKDRRYNGQKKMNNDLQNTTQQTKDRVTWNHKKPGVNSDVPKG